MIIIGFNALGHLGRLGNQMFQYASLRGIAAKNGYNYFLPPSNNQDEWKDHQLFVPFKLPNISLLNVQYIDGNRPIIQEKDFSFDGDLFNNCPKWVNLQGFFQSEKYFKEIEDEIREDFQFRDEIYQPSKQMIDTLDNPISLHIRRTDYTANKNHNPLELDYYKEALKCFDKKRPVIIFSDDPEWCNSQEIFSEDRFLVSENNSNYIDLCLMTLCKDHIIANSSFSWWGAWLAKGNKVIAPSKWFGPDNSHLDTKDLYCTDWVVI
jgi:hypothetical protein